MQVRRAVGLSISMCVFSTVWADLLPNPCLVSIELSASEYLNAVGAVPGLKSKGPSIVFVPSRQPVGYMVEKLGPAEFEAAPSAQVVHTTKKEFAGYPPIKFDFSDPPLLPIQWREVGVPSQTTWIDYEVPAGTYRFILTYAITDPRKGKGREVALCRVRSAPFVLKTSVGYSTYYGTDFDTKPNNRLKLTEPRVTPLAEERKRRATRPAA